MPTAVAGRDQHGQQPLEVGPRSLPVVVAALFGMVNGYWQHGHALPQHGLQPQETGPRSLSVVVAASFGMVNGHWRQGHALPLS